MDRGDNCVIKAKRFKKRTGGTVGSSYLVDVPNSFFPVLSLSKPFLSLLVSYNPQAGVIEAGVFQIALIRPSVNVINLKYRMIGEKNSGTCEGPNLHRQIHSNVLSVHTFLTQGHLGL